MNEYMQTWDKLAQPPAAMLKTIKGGRLNGFSDINPQWRIRALTEHFGMCGAGWKYTLDKMWTEQGDGGEVMCFVNVSLYVKVGDQWSEAIPGNGGNSLIAKESRGLHNSDEGWKMAITDAIGTAAKMIGVAADIYLGNWDGWKYRDQDGDGKTKPPDAWSSGKKGDSKPPEKPTEKPPEQAKPSAIPWSKMTQQQRKETVLAAVKQCKGNMKLEDAAAKLKEISEKTDKLNQLDPKDRDEVFAAIADAQYSVEAELATLNQ